MTLMEEIEAHAESTRALLGRLSRELEFDPEVPHTVVTDPAVWLGRAQEHIQIGYECARRAVLAPRTL
jgi:hypothetical protein